MPNQVASCSGWRAFIVEVAPGVTVEFISAFLIAGFFVALLALVLDNEKSVTDVHLLFEKNVRISILDALQKSNSWAHDGHIASWVRRNVLPRFLDDCRRNQATRTLQIAILDPNHTSCCESYLAHIRSLEPDEQRIADLRELRVEICTTVYTCARAAHIPHFRIKVYIKTDADYIRRDITTSRAFWTTPGKLKPSIVFENRSTSTYYHLSVANFELATTRFRALSIEEASKAHASNATGVAEVQAVLTAAFGTLPAFCSMDFCESVLARFEKDSRNNLYHSR